LARLDQSQRSGNAVAFSEYLVGMGQCASAFTLCNRIESAEERREAMIALAGIFASEHKYPEARYIASLLDRRTITTPNGGNDTVSADQRALYMIATQQAYNGDFAEAKKTIQELDDARYAAHLWYRFAQIQASLGFYDDAVASVEMVKDAGLAERRNETLREIQAYRTAKATRKFNRHRHGFEGYLERLRSLAGIFSDPLICSDKTSLDEQEARASSTQQPNRRASQWRRIAWACWQAGNKEGCQRAILALAAQDTASTCGAKNEPGSHGGLPGRLFLTGRCNSD
jgi:hypothetical protein